MYEKLQMSTLRNLDAPSVPPTHRMFSGARRVDGYALVALLALMTILMLAAMAAAPSLRQQSQRELEKEAIVRGEEVAEAIRLYVNCTNTLPTSMEQLLEGAPCQGRVEKVQVLRAYAARDPLSSTGKWRLIRPTDKTFEDFVLAVARYNENQVPKTTDPKLAAQPLLQAIVNMQLTGIVNTKTKADEESSRDDEESSTTTTGPFIGVASRSDQASVITYYDIELQDKWVFTPLFR